MRKIWNNDSIIAESKKYKTITEFELGSPGAYGAARRLGILDQIRRKMFSPYLPRGYWTDELLIREIQKYKTVTEFREGSLRAYGSWRRRPDKDKFNHFFVASGNTFNRQVYRILNDKTGDVYIGLTYNLARRQQQHRASRMGAVFGPDLLLESVSELLPVSVAQKEEQRLIDYYINLGYRVHNIKKAGGLGGSISKELSLSECVELAKKYQYRRDVYRGDFRAWSTIKKNGWEEKAFSHMPRRRTTRVPRKWAKERCIEEARKYTSRSSLQKGCVACYQAIRRQGLEQEAFSHMSPPLKTKEQGSFGNP